MSEYRIYEENAGVFTCIAPEREMSWNGVTIKDIERIVDTISRYYSLNGNKQEAIQAGIEGAARAAAHYDERKGPFETYIKPFVFEKVILALLRKKR